MIRFLVSLLLFVCALPALAQETPEQERSWLLTTVENQLSSPNRQIRLGGIRGVLSSEAEIGEITIADRQGIWLRIVNARIEWTRSALLLGRLDIQTLGAERIEISRRPLPDESLPSPEAQPFRLPELPLSIDLRNLDIDRIVFGEPVFGLASELSASGRLSLAGGALDTELNLERLDGPGGSLRLAAAYANATENLDLDLSLTEPENGVVANVLNIEGKPPVSLALTGSGPLGDLGITLALDADGERVLTGAARLDRGEGGLAVASELQGPISRLIAPAYRGFFGDDTSLRLGGVAKNAGGFRLDTLTLRSGAMSLDAQGETAADGFLQRLRLDADVADPAGGRVVLPVPGGETTMGQGRLNIVFGETQDERWTGSLALSQLSSSDFSAGNVRLSLEGLARNIADPAARSLTYTLDGEVSGIAAEREDVAEALGDRMTLSGNGAWQAGAPVTVEQMRLAGKALSVSLAGTLADFIYRGRLAVETASLAPFSGLAGRNLSGGMTLSANGEIRPVSGAFDLTLDGNASELRISSPAADNLLAGTTAITGRVARGEQGLTAERLRIANEQMELTADGTFATGAANFGFGLALSDLALLTPSAEGRLTATGRADGYEGRINLTLDARAPSGRLAGKTLSDGIFGFRGVLQNNDLDGHVTGNAFLDGVRAELSSAVALAGGEKRLSDLLFNAGGARLTGAVMQRTDGLLDGSLTLDAPDISTAAALLLTSATGAVDADIRLSPAGGTQALDVKGTIRHLVVGEMRVGEAELRAQVADAFGVPAVDGTVRASSVRAGGVDIENLTGQAARTGDATNFSADARLANGATAGTAGALSPEGQGYRLALQRLNLAQGQLVANLRQPASLLVEGSNVIVDALTLDVGGGTVSVAGSATETIDLNVVIDALPLSIANAVRPDLELGGTVNGSASVEGPRASPAIGFTLSGVSVTAAALRGAGLGALTVDARGTTSGSRLAIDAAVNDGNGFRATAEGGVPLDNGQIAMNVAVESFPLATLNVVARGQDLRGIVRGSARVGGTASAPTASFNVTGTGISAAPLADAGAAPIEATAAGSFANGVVTLESANARGPQGLALSASGRVPLSGAGLRMGVQGSIPLALGNRVLADRGTQFSGTVSVNANVSGSIARPAIDGALTTSGASVVDPSANVRLNNIALNAAIAGQTVNIQSLTAQVAGGGNIGAGGTISLDVAAGLPADLRVRLNQVRYTDGELVVATVSGALALNGALMRDPLLSGSIDIERAEISIAGSLGGGAAMLDVKHIAPSRQVVDTLRRARANDGTPTPTSRPSVLRLDVAVRARNQIFVRGRGLDAELGGEVRLTGPATNIQPVGGFRLIRGRLSILGERITFDEGTVSLIGDLDPFVDFVARSERTDLTVFITVRGRVSDPQIAFSSQPELPQDEVLARLIFNRGLNELSAFQIARLAAAAAELAGGSNGSLLGNLRDAAGLDDIDIVSDGNGNTAVRAGRYIQDNIYLGVEAGSGGTTRGTINLDITDELKAKGALGSDGDSSLGIFFERDY